MCGILKATLGVQMLPCTQKTYNVNNGLHNQSYQQSSLSHTLCYLYPTVTWTDRSRIGSVGY